MLSVEKNIMTKIQMCEFIQLVFYHHNAHAYFIQMIDHATICSFKPKHDFDYVCFQTQAIQTYFY